jgi:5-hydroxyisourate hydrolase
MTVTTQVLDLARGRPASGVTVVLERNDGAEDWRVMVKGETDADGRVKNLTTASSLLPGLYRLTFGTATYFERVGVKVFYPQVIVVFETAPGEAHYHLPLSLSPFGYTTHRGS